jgi:NTE family protein
VVGTPLAIPGHRSTIKRMSNLIGTTRRLLGHPRRTLVLTGGGSRGAGQIGMLHALVENGVRFDAVVGCSVGALAASRYAADPTLGGVESLEQVWRDLRSRDVFPVTPYGVLRGVTGRSHLVSPKALRQLVQREAPVRDLGETAVPLGVVTTRLDNGKPVLWTNGPAVDILNATCALPGILPPVRLPDGAEHIDGGISSAAPVLLAQQLQPCDEIWLLDVLSTPDEHQHHASLRDVYLAAFSHAVQSQVTNELRALKGPALRHIKLAPQWSVIDSTDFTYTSELIEAGYEASKSLLSRRR